MSYITSSKSPCHTPETNAKLYSCETCEFTCFDKDALKDHKQNSHKQVNCRKCDFTCATFEDLKTHKLSSHPQQQFRCEICDFVLIHSNQLAKHMRLVHVPNNNSNERTFQANSSEVMNVHIDPDHTTMMNCSLCDYEATSKEDLRIHIDNFHKTRYFSRSYKFNQRHFPRETVIKMTKHEDTVNENTKDTEDICIEEEKKFTCSACNSGQKIFAHSDALELHMSYFHKNTSQK